MTQKLLFIFFVSILASISLSEVRTLYKDCTSSKENALEFYNKLKSVDSPKNATLASYKAAAITLKAKYEKGIKNKKHFFKKGVTLLEKNIAKEPNNIEIRFIRLSIQENVPKLLKYKKNILEDKTFIFQNLKQVKDKKLRNYIKSFVLQSKSFTKEEKSVISKL